MASSEAVAESSNETPPGLSRAAPPTLASESQEEWVDEDEEEDVEYEPATEGEEDEDEEVAEEDGGDEEYYDADDALGEVEIDLSLSEETTEGAVATGDLRWVTRMTGNELFGLYVRQHDLRRLLRQSRGTQESVDGDNEEGDEEARLYGPRRRRRRGSKSSVTDKYPKPPSATGTELMSSGIFGSTDTTNCLYACKKKTLGTRLLSRELGLGPSDLPKRANTLMTQAMIPSSAADTIIHYNAKCYSGQFSEDGNFFFSCGKDFRVRMYDTSNPYRWKYYKTVLYPHGQWTITDASLSPDNRFLAYSSIRSVVCLASTDPSADDDAHYLDFSKQGGHRGRFGGSFSYFGLWSIRFSGDGRELLGGAGDTAVYVYDLETRQTILRICGHQDDVNAVCYADASSPHILYSGSDDTTLKVWDRRSMGDGRAAGVFLGHTEGLTYVDSKGDGRYILSNSKDQTMKLWDLRKMMNTDRLDNIDAKAYSLSGFDYRYMDYDAAYYQPHPDDCSLVTFRGHRVLKTLIRCHFSPPGSTDSRYVYSGSEDGSVYVYNLDATLAGKINVHEATLRSRRRDAASLGDEEYGIFGPRGIWETCVRDASWHPNAPVIAATSWNGWGRATGTCTVHSWNDGATEDEGEPEMGTCVDEKLEPDEVSFQNPMHRTPIPQEARAERGGAVLRAMGRARATRAGA